MATSKNQRYGIMAILVVTVVGTIGSFAVMVLSSQNQANEAAAQQKITNSYQNAAKSYQEKIDSQATQLSNQYFSTFSQYSSQVGAFDMSGVSSLKYEDLVVGNGAQISGTTKFAAYYIGWNPKGKIFDQSIDGDKLKAPIYHSNTTQGFISLDQGIDKAMLIQGWKDGMKGMKIGGVREITIPSDLAYGESGKGDDIPPNTPLKFVVLAIPAPESIAEPALPASLYQGVQ